MMQLAQGVTLKVINHHQFKTVRIMVRFRTHLSVDTVAKRVLISNLWETSNQVYPNNQALNLRLSELYGANFAATVSKKGQAHYLTLQLSVVDGQLIGEDTLTAGVAFLRDVLFKPDLDVTGQAFNHTHFLREQKNLMQYLASTVEDRSYYASRRLSELYFSSSDQSVPSIASEALIAKETAQSVYRYYQDMLAQDNIDIMVFGQVSEAEVMAAFREFEFSDRPDMPLELYHQPLKTSPIVQKESKPGQQSVLQLAYQHPVTFGDTSYLSMQVLNGLLGAFPHSKLFVNVREKAGLAYYATSSFDSFTGLLKLSSGIDANNYEKTLELIKEQVQSLADGDFDDQALTQTKKMLQNHYYMSLDNQANLMEQAYLAGLLPDRYLDEAAWQAQLAAVTKQDVMDLARALELQVVYFLEGVSYGD